MSKYLSSLVTSSCSFVLRSVHAVCLYFPCSILGDVVTAYFCMMDVMMMTRTNYMNIDIVSPKPKN